jgi:hypothetical protein
VQVYKPLSNGQPYRLFASDGVHCNPFTMLATQLNELVENKKINRNCIIRVNKHVCSTMTYTIRRAATVPLPALSTAS